MMRISTKLIGIVAVGTFVSTFNLTLQARPLGFTSVKLVSQEGAEDSWEVSVRCSGINEPRILVSQTSTGLWCPKGLSEVGCAAKKIDAAEMLCSLRYKKELRLAEEREALENRATKESELQQRKQKVQQELLALERRKSNLLSRELELDSRELEIRRRLSDL